MNFEIGIDNVSPSPGPPAIPTRNLHPGGAFLGPGLLLGPAAG